jgi:hypothetical protein
MLANKQRSDQPRRPEQLAASNLHHGFCVAAVSVRLATLCGAAIWMLFQILAS